jgi:two-component system, response regulator
MRGVILLVEDNASDEKLTLRAFAKSGVANEIHVARDGQEALDYLLAAGAHQGRGGGTPAVVLLDLKLPKVDGLEVLRRMRAAPSIAHVPVVILTSSREEQDLVRGYAAGANAYVRKPVDFVEFVEAARTLGLFWLLMNEVPNAGMP